MKPSGPLLHYPGSKWRLAEQGIAYFPPHRTDAEAYGGAAAVLMRKPCRSLEVYNDLDHHRAEMGFGATSATKRTPETLFYIDPPYPPPTRQRGGRVTGTR